MNLYSLLKPLLFSLPPETSHVLSLKALQSIHDLGLSSLIVSPTPELPCRVMGINFPNPLGLAAGLDKNADYVEGLADLGFGFLEIGTITPRAQPGNSRPRVFRLTKANALINRMGFNNKGLNYLAQRLEKISYQGILGINLGKNLDTPLEMAVNDYCVGVQTVYPWASYITINISSPNTPGLRALQYHKELQRLLSALKAQQSHAQVSYGRYVPLAIKISPDLSITELESMANLLIEYEIDGVIATNTSLSRIGVEDSNFANEAGGLSGQPLCNLSTKLIKQLNTFLEQRIPIIAAGGIMSAKDAEEKLAAGASLLQIYTGLIYKGPRLIKEILDSLVKKSI